MTQQGGANLLAVEEGIKSRSVKNLLRSIWFYRRRAVEFNRPSGKIQD